MIANTSTRGICLVAALAISLFAFLANCGAFAAESKRVMVLHSFGQDFKPWSEYGRTIRTELARQSPWPLDIVDHSLVSARSGGEDAERAFINYLRAIYSKSKLDLIVSIGAPAAAFVQRHRADFFRDTPMVLAAIEERRVQFTNLAANDTAVAVRIDYVASLDNILHVLPATRHVVMVVGTSPIEKFWRDEIARSLPQRLTDRITVSWTDELSFEQILAQSAKLPANTAIFWELMIVDAAGVVHEGNAALARLNAVTSAPIFSYDESFFGEIVGGPLLAVMDTSRATADVAVRILGGEKAGDIKLPPIGFAAPRFDWRQLQRWGISEASLPPGSEIHFREASMWERFRWQILAVVAAMLLQAGLICWLIYEHHQRTLAEIRSRSAMGELANMNRFAAAGELSASIAHEINQPITGMVLKANAALRWLSGERPDIERASGAVRDIVDAGHHAGDVIKGVRAMFRTGASARVPVDVNNLINAALEIVRMDLQSRGVRVEVKLDESLPAVAGDPVQLQQVMVNLVVNAIEAMGAVEHRVLSVRSHQNESGLVLVSIEDSGTGISEIDREKVFDPLFTTKPAGMGMGLSICRSIIENHSGRIWVSPAPSRGAVFHIELPVVAERGCVVAHAVNIDPAPR